MKVVDVIRHLLEEIEQIAACAIRINDDDTKIVTGSMHAVCVSDAVYRHHLIPEDAYAEQDEETGKIPGYSIEAGFLTDTGRFVNRREAYRIARMAGQVEANPSRRLWHSDLE